MAPRSRAPGVSTGIATVVRSLRFAARRLRRAPGFSLAVLASLAICIGPNVAVFSALYALVLKPLPFPEPSQLVSVLNIAEKSGGQVVLSSTTQYHDFKAHADLFAGFATLRSDTVTLDEATSPARVEVESVSANFFDVLGARPVLGRGFAADEDTAGHDRVLVVSARYWTSHYNADPAVIGTKALLANQPYTIVGVAPRALESLVQNAAFYAPYVPARSKFDLQTRYRGDLALYGRLKRGVTREAGLAQLQSLEADFRRERAAPATRALVASAGYRLALEPLRPGGAVSPRSALWLLQAGAVFVLLIGGVNVVNLFLARLNSKRGELAVRVALGAGPGALLAEMLAESALLTAGAVLAGTALAFAGLRLFNGYLPVLVPGAPPIPFDPAVLLAVVGVAIVMAGFVGFLPLRVVGRDGLHVGATRTASSTGGARRMSGLLVISQVAFAVVLLVGATLLLRSLGRVLANDPGYDAAHIVVGRVTLPSAYRTPAARLVVQRRVLDAINSVPGVEHVAASLRAVLGNERPVPFARRGEAIDGETQPLIHIVAVSPDYFATMGLRVMSGRAFNEADEFSKQAVAIVDQSFCDRYAPGRAVEGEEIYLNWGFPLGVDAWPRIVGVVNRANLTGLDSRDNLPVVYVPTVGFASTAFDVLVRSTRSTADLVRDLHTTLAAIDPGIHLAGAASLDDTLSTLLLPRRGVTLLVGLFSTLALLLAAIGLYGVLAYDVTQRTREIGIRGAIGASRAQIVGLILRQGLGKTAIGLVVGLIGAAFLTRGLGALLFEVGYADPVSYLAAIGLLTAVALVACWVPARRASRVDPIVALRAE